jgi:hypothetical protein
MAVPEDRPEVAALVPEIQIPVLLVTKVGSRTCVSLNFKQSCLTCRQLAKHKAVLTGGGDSIPHLPGVNCQPASQVAHRRAKSSRPSRVFLTVSIP